MLLHRVRGLWNTYHGILAIILTVVFWIYLVITGAVSNGASGGAEAYHIRAWAKPGVTGLAQVKGYGRDPINDREVEESAKLDIEYIENWSLPLDLWIVFKALLQIVEPPRYTE